MAEVEPVNQQPIIEKFLPHCVVSSKSIILEVPHSEAGVARMDDNGKFYDANGNECHKIISGVWRGAYPPTIEVAWEGFTKALANHNSDRFSKGLPKITFENEGRIRGNISTKLSEAIIEFEKLNCKIKSVETQEQDNTIPFKYDEKTYNLSHSGGIVLRMVGEPISYSLLWISKILKNYDSNEVTLEISFYDHKNREQKIEIPMGEALQKKGIMTLASHGVMVAEGMAKDLATYINHLLVYNPDIPEEKQYETLGWKNDTGSFVLGKIEISKDKVEPITITNAPQSLTDAITTNGDIKGWFDITRQLLKYERTRFKCYLSCSAPILTALQQKTRMMNDYGESSRGKTTTNEVGMGIWGNPEALNLSAIATKVGTEEVVKLFSNIPVNLDDVQAADPELLKQVVYMIGNESGKLRGKKGGGLRDVAHWKTIVFTTGEAKINDSKSFTGSMVRALEIYGGLGADDADAVKLFEEGRETHYGHIAPILIRKILEKKAELPGMYAQAQKELSKIPAKNGIGDRLIKTFAVFVVGGILFEEIMKENGEETRDPIDVCEKIMRDVTAEIVDESYAIRALKHIYSWIDTKRRYFLVDDIADQKAPSDIYGNLKVATIDIYTKPLKDELTKAEFDYDRVIKDWEQLGFIRKKNDQVWTNGFGNGRGVKLDTEKITKDTQMVTPYVQPSVVESMDKQMKLGS